MDYEFLLEQKKADRVKLSYIEKKDIVKDMFNACKLNYPPYEIFIRIFKYERILELWARESHNSKFILIKKYKMANFSGDLGPKRKEGDKQIPEGFYYIDRFNNNSKYYLSLRINYPNASDVILGDKTPGSDIFIHGGVNTVGCIPITDDCIKEIYIVALDTALNTNKKINVHIYPYYMNDYNHINFKKIYENRKATILFWDSIKIGFDYFENQKILP